MSGCQVVIWDSLALLHKRKIVCLCALSFDDTNIPLFSYTMEYLFRKDVVCALLWPCLFSRKKNNHWYHSSQGWITRKRRCVAIVVSIHMKESIWFVGFYQLVDHVSNKHVLGITTQSSMSGVHWVMFIPRALVWTLREKKKIIYNSQHQKFNYYWLVSVWMSDHPTWCLYPLKLFILTIVLFVLETIETLILTIN